MPKKPLVFWSPTAMRIEPYDSCQLDAVIRLSLRAWTPVFDSIQKAMNADVYREFYEVVGAERRSLGR